MTKKSKPPQTGIQIFIRIIFWILMIIVVGIACLFALLIWVLLGPSEPGKRLVLQNYEELREIFENENVRTDGKTLPLYESLSTSNYWYTDYDGNIPPELLNENTLVTSNRDGLTDVSYIGLFDLSEKSAETLGERLSKKFVKDGEAVEIGSYTENALCLNHVNLGGWSINSKKKNDFFQFCTQTRYTEKIEWDLIMPRGENGFSLISITQYVGTTFFTVRHGSS